MDTITITLEEYKELTNNTLKLEILMELGVDNWEYYEYAMDTYTEVVDNQ